MPWRTGVSKPLFSFGVMADCQYADADDTDALVTGTKDEIYNNRYRRSPAKLKEAVDAFNQHELAFIVHLGDFIDRNLEEAAVLHAITANAQAPLWHVLGNHDFMGSEGNLQRILDMYRMPAHYYSHVINGYRFVVLDTNDLGVIAYDADSEEWRTGQALLSEMKQENAINAYPWNGGIGKQQLQWLRDQLNEAVKRHEKVVLFAHHPVFPPSVLNALNHEDILQVIEECPNVIAFINGHHHLGNYGSKTGVHYLTVNGMIQGDDNAFGIVRLFDDHIDVEGYGRLPRYTWPLSAS